MVPVMAAAITPVVTQPKQEGMKSCQRRTKSNGCKRVTLIIEPSATTRLSLLTSKLFAWIPNNSLKPDNSVAYMNIGHVLGNLDRFHEAISAFEQAIRL